MLPGDVHHLFAFSCPLQKISLQMLPFSRFRGMLEDKDR